MILSRAVMEHLRHELQSEDPWRLESNEYEQERLAVMRTMTRCARPYGHGLEVGCAAGAFSEHLAQCCQKLTIVDILPEALARTRLRLNEAKHINYLESEISCARLARAEYDLVIVAEVLYYLNSDSAVRRAIARIASCLKSGGTLIFCSALDAVSHRWGLPIGAESAMREWSRHMVQVDSVICRGKSADEHAIVVKYSRKEGPA